MFKNNIDINKLACIEYHGSAGITQHCLDAMTRLIQFGERLEKAWLISSQPDQYNCRTHAFILTLFCERQVVINSGFSSGYGGEGPKGLSKALQLLLRHKVDIEEYQVKPSMMERLEHNCLLKTDIQSTGSSRPVRPNRYYDYIFFDTERSRNVFGEKDLNFLFPPVIPYAIIDTRILDLALTLEENPDASLLTGYRRLEGIFREKHADLKGLSGAKLFSRAFQGENSLLHWPKTDKSEVEGRASLFIGVFKGYRNKRAHHEQDYELSAAVREFVLLNELYVLESTAVIRELEHVAAK